MLNKILSRTIKDNIILAQQHCTAQLWLTIFSVMHADWLSCLFDKPSSPIAMIYISLPCRCKQGYGAIGLSRYRRYISSSRNRFWSSCVFSQICLLDRTRGWWVAAADALLPWSFDVARQYSGCEYIGRVVFGGGKDKYIIYYCKIEKIRHEQRFSYMIISSKKLN